MSLNKESCLIGTGDQLISILELQLEGKKKMNISEFLMGARFTNRTTLGSVSNTHLTLPTNA